MRLAVLAVPLICLGAEETAVQLFRDAQKAEKEGQTVRAYLLYSQAAVKDPTNLLYWTRAQALRPIATMAQPEIGAAMGSGSDEKPASEASKDAIDPSIVGTISEWDIIEAKKHPLPPRELKAAAGNKDFKLRGDSKSLFEQVGAAFNLLVVFDSSYQPADNIRFEVTGMDYRESLRALEAATNSFVVPAADRLILVANDSPQKRKELEATTAIVIPIPEPVNLQEVQELGTGVRGTLDIQRLMVDTAHRLVLIRDVAWKVRAAEMLFHDLMQPQAQVAIDIDVVSMDISKSSTWGLGLPTQTSLLSFGSIFSKLPANVIGSGIPAGFASFLTFGGGASFIGLGLTTAATLFASTTQSYSTTVLKSEVVTADGVAATFHVGDKYPIVTGNYSGSALTSGSYTPPPQVSFEDLGLMLKIKPQVHGMDEMTLDVSAEFKLLGATGLNGIPIIENRKFESKLRLMNGEWAVLAGLVSTSETEAFSGLPGVMSIPFLRKNTPSHDHSETMIILKPHLLRLPPTEAVMHTAWIGTETRARDF